MDLVNNPVKSEYVMNGPIAGVIAAQQLQDQQDAQGRSFRDQDLSYLDKLNTYQNAMADNPVKEVDRANLLSAGQDTQGAWGSGQQAQLMEAQRAAKLQEMLDKKTQSQLEMIDKKNTWAQSAFQQLSNEQDPVTEARNQSIYEDYILPQARAVGADKGLPPKWNRELVMPILQSRQQSAVYSTPFVQKKMLQTQDETSKEKIATAHNTAIVEASRVQGQNAAERQANSIPADQQLEISILRDAKTQGQITQSQYNQLKTIYNDKYKAQDKAKIESDTAADRTEATMEKTKGEEKYNKWLKGKGIPAGTDPVDFARARASIRQDVIVDAYIKDKIGDAKIVKEGSPTGIATPKGSVPSSSNPNIKFDVKTGQWLRKKGTNETIPSASPTPVVPATSAIQESIPASAPLKETSPLQQSMVQIDKQISEQVNSKNPDMELVKALVQAKTKIQNQIGTKF